ncbi:MAG: ATP-binding cassette domain-containing protein [Candidatus Promineifilaceae bacterium]
MNCLYELQGVVQKYHGRIVLNVPRLSIYKGELLAVVGPSGAGKSTLLRLLNFLEMPTAGRLFFDGTAVSPELPLVTRRRVTTVFQTPNLLNRSVYANVQYGLKLRGLDVENGRIDHWLARLGLGDFRHQPAKKLSAGEAQRVSLARALAIQPDVLLLDEPTANLDPANVALIEQIVREDCHQRGTTVVLVTHNIFQAKRIADRVGLLIGGKLVEVAETAVFFDNPSRPETAAFVRGDLVIP